jgi:hypothetical protein
MHVFAGLDNAAQTLYLQAHRVFIEARTSGRFVAAMQQLSRQGDQRRGELEAHERQRLRMQLEDGDLQPEARARLATMPLPHIAALVSEAAFEKVRALHVEDYVWGPDRTLAEEMRQLQMRQRREEAEAEATGPGRPAAASVEEAKRPPQPTSVEETLQEVHRRLDRFGEQIAGNSRQLDVIQAALTQLQLQLQPQLQPLPDACDLCGGRTGGRRNLVRHQKTASCEAKAKEKAEAQAQAQASQLGKRPAATRPEALEAATRPTRSSRPRR